MSAVNPLFRLPVPEPGPETRPAVGSYLKKLVRALEAMYKDLAAAINRVGVTDGGFGAPVAATLASGALTLADTRTFRLVAVSPEAGATDDLTAIFGGNPGDVLVLTTAGDGISITVRDGSGLALAGDFALSSGRHVLTLICMGVGGLWVEVGRSANH